MQIWPFFVGSFRRDRAAGAIVSGIVTGDVQVSYWPTFFLRP